MTAEELVRMWASESDAANDCIVEILSSYMEFVKLAIKHAELRKETFLLALAKKRLQDWQPILDTVIAAQKKAKEQQ